MSKVGYPTDGARLLAHNINSSSYSERKSLMSLLSTIRESLFLNPNIYFKESRTFRYFPPSVMGHVEMHYMHVSPLHGLYTIPELQTFVEGLLSIQAVEAEHFCFISEEVLQFGRLAFEEVVGYSHEQSWKTLEIISNDVVLPVDFEKNIYKTDTGIITNDLKRRMTIYVYPDHGYMYDCDGNLTFKNRVHNIRPIAERPPSNRSESAALDSVWIP